MNTGQTGYRYHPRLRSFAANDATKICGERRDFDTNQAFTLVLNEICDDEAGPS